MIKKNLLLVILFFSVGNATQGLFFSEYGEGTSNNKYFEIYNGTGADIDLSEYSISRCVNGCDDGDLTFDYLNDIQFEVEQY